MREEIKLIVFDWAGTTVDYGCIAPLAVFERIFENKNIHLTREAILKPMGMGKEIISKHFLQQKMQPDSGRSSIREIGHKQILMKCLLSSM